MIISANNKSSATKESLYKYNSGSENILSQFHQSGVLVLPLEAVQQPSTIGIAIWRNNDDKAAQVDEAN